MLKLKKKIKYVKTNKGVVWDAMGAGEKRARDLHPIDFTSLALFGLERIPSF